MPDCSHDRDAKTCPYCPVMEARRKKDAGESVSALPEQDESVGDEEEPPRAHRHTRGGRASLDEWEADDDASDGLTDLYSRGVRRNPRDTGERDILSADDQDALGEL